MLNPSKSQSSTIHAGAPPQQQPESAAGASLQQQPSGVSPQPGPSGIAAQPQQQYTPIKQSLSIFSISSLPSPVGRLIRGISVSPIKPVLKHEDVESLTLEMEVQELLDQVTVLEEGHAHMLEIQRSIMGVLAVHIGGDVLLVVMVDAVVVYQQKLELDELLEEV